MTSSTWSTILNADTRIILRNDTDVYSVVRPEPAITDQHQGKRQTAEAEPGPVDAGHGSATVRLRRGTHPNRLCAW